MAAFCQASGDLPGRDIKKRVNPIYDEDEEYYRSTTESSKLSGDCYYDDTSRTGRMDTIYESYEEFVDSSDERSNEASSSTDGTSSARISADSPTSVLRRSVRAWCDATGLPTTVLVETKDRSFRLHKLPLTTRSGYFKRLLAEKSQVKLGDDFPGGSDVFEIIANFCYNSMIHMNAANVAVLRCCSEYLEMTEEHGKENLRDRTEYYLTQVVFHSWEDTLAVLQQSVDLMPRAEELQIVGRCIDYLASAARNNLRADRSSVTSEEFMVKDILELPVTFFERLVRTLRKQGLDEKPVSQLILKYARRWLLDKADTALDEMGDSIHLLEATVRLLPLERFLVPLKFLFSLHGCALAWHARRDCMQQLEVRIVSQLELATLDDLLLSMRMSKDSTAHMDSMQQMVSEFMSQQEILFDGSDLLSERELKNASSYSFLAVSAVVKVWDEYVAEIASIPELSPTRFLELVAAVSSNIRTNHDLMYRAIHVYLKSHSTLTHAERLAICQGLDCQKLSSEACMHAVQNELMPLRMIVQAMFVQQLQSKDAENSSREARLPPQRFTPPSQASVRDVKDDGLPLGVILQRDAAFREAAFLKDDFEATKARLKELELELMRMKKTMDVDGSGSNSAASCKGKRKASGNCMYQVWGTQANGIRFGQRITKTFQKLGLGSFWKSRPSGTQRNRNTSSEAGNNTCRWQDVQEVREEQQVERDALRASSFRKAETESRTAARHVRHHSFS